MQKKYNNSLWIFGVDKFSRFLTRGSARAAAFVLVFGSVIAAAEVGLNDKGDPIAFFAPLDGRYLAFDEAFFSVPRPIVRIHSVVFGNPDDYPNNTTIQQTGPAEMRIRVRGIVFDFLADMVADELADIEQVRIYSQIYGTVATVPLLSSDSSATHPYGEDFDDSSVSDALRPYPFAGQFDYGEFTLPINPGYNGISIEATNVNKTTGTATVRIKATINSERGGYDLTAEVSDVVDTGLYNPILVYINDPEVTIENYGEKDAFINGHRVGLRFIDGQLQLDRPIIGINHSPPAAIPNVVDVVGDPRSFVIQYGEQETEFHWSYTAMIQPVQRILSLAASDP